MRAIGNDLHMDYSAVGQTTHLAARMEQRVTMELATPSGKISLSDDERRRRVNLTRENADQFLKVHRERGARFIPVGVIQGLDSKSYASQIGEYIDMGYRHIALGGLVPRTDTEVLEIVRSVHAEVKRYKSKPWIHLLGIFRPSLQPHFRELGIGGFDSASYFRKAWLRSDQNYLGADGRWYAAIRIPPLNDPRTKSRLQASGMSDAVLRTLEAEALAQLRAYDRGQAPLEVALNAVIEYDQLLARSKLVDGKMIAAYRKTLETRPWRACKCTMCTALGIEIVIFRGVNRNKRRGAHNTMQLFQTVERGSTAANG